jgi:hypothetical protein
MRTELQAILGLLGGYFFLNNATDVAAEFGSGHTNEYDDIFRRYGEMYTPDQMGPQQYAKLLKAVAIRESSLDPTAKRTEDWTVTVTDPDGTTHEVAPISKGLMQVLIPQRLNVEQWPEGDPEDSNSQWTSSIYESFLKKLEDPDYNVKIGSQVLQWNIEDGGASPHYVEKGVALFNGWNRTNKRARPPEKFTNQDYVDDVMELFEQVNLGG